MTPRAKSKSQQRAELLARANEQVNAYRDGVMLYNMAKELKITPVQAVVRYFCLGKGHYKVKDDYQGLLKILSLLKECDWEYDPAVKVNDGCDIRDVNERWVVWDRDRPGLTTTEIRCQEDVVERFIKPLLGDTFDFAKVLLQLAAGDEAGAEQTVKAAYELQSHGGDRRSQEARQAREDQVANRHLKPTNQLSSESRDRIKARLERDHPDVAAALDRGEHRSARAAAIAAGIIKPVPTVRLVDDPPKVAAAIAKHFNRAEIEALCQALLSIPTNEQ